MEPSIAGQSCNLGSRAVQEIENALYVLLAAAEQARAKPKSWNRAEQEMEKAIHVLLPAVEWAGKKLSIVGQGRNHGSKAEQGIENALYVLLIVAE